MITDSPPLPLTTDLVGSLEKRLFTGLVAEAVAWSECASALTRWEDEHLLDNPGAELLQHHKATTERLLRLGRLLSQAVAHAGFPEPSAAEMIRATERMLQDKLAMWHGSMGRERRDALLRAAFHES